MSVHITISSEAPPPRPSYLNRSTNRYRNTDRSISIDEQQSQIMRKTASCHRNSPTSMIAPILSPNSGYFHLLLKSKEVN